MFFSVVSPSSALRRSVKDTKRLLMMEIELYRNNKIGLKFSFHIVIESTQEVVQYRQR